MSLRHSASYISLPTASISDGWVIVSCFCWRSAGSCGSKLFWKWKFISCFQNNLKHQIFNIVYNIVPIMAHTMRDFYLRLFYCGLPLKHSGRKTHGSCLWTHPRHIHLGQRFWSSSFLSFNPLAAGRLARFLGEKSSKKNSLYKIKDI